MPEPGAPSRQALRGGRFAEKTFTPQEFVAELRSGLPRLHFGLARGLQQQIALPTVAPSRQSSGSDLWPCPLPLLPSLTRRDSGARRRQRLRRCLVACELARQIVGTLNFLALGSCARPPSSLSRCPVPSAAQRVVLRRIEDRVKTFARLAPCAGSGLGRAIHKLRDLDEMS